MQAKRQAAQPVQHQIGQHRAHQRLVDQPALEGAAMGGPVMRLAQRRPHQPGRRHGGVEPGVMHHGKDGADAGALLADPPGQGALIFDLGRAVRAVAELVLEPLDADGVAPALQPARHQKAGQPAPGPRQGQEPVRHRRRAEPFMPGQPPGAPVRLGPRGIGAQVRAALLFRHRHAQRRALLGGKRQHRRVVAPREQRRPPVARQIAGARNDRDGGIGHGQRAAMPRLDLAGQIDHGGMGQVTGRPALPGDRMIAGGDGIAHETVPGGVKAQLVQPPAAAVEQHKLGRVAVGIARRPRHLGPAQKRAVTGRPLGLPAAGLQHGAQGRIVAPQVAVAGRGRLVQHLMRAQIRRRIDMHGQALLLPPAGRS